MRRYDPSVEEEVDLAVAQALARAEAADPRPKKKPCIWDKVDFMAGATWQSLGLSPPAGRERFGNRLRKGEKR